MGSRQPRAEGVVGDFSVDGLEGRCREIAVAINGYLIEELGKEPYGGGCKAYHSPEEWAARGESYGRDALLILCHDGGDLAPACNPAYERAEEYTRFRDFLESVGVQGQQCTSWYTAIYALPVEVHRGDLCSAIASVQERLDDYAEYCRDDESYDAVIESLETALRVLQAHAEGREIRIESEEEG